MHRDKNPFYGLIFFSTQKSRRAGRESIMDPGPPIRELNVDGGYLMRLVQGPELPNFIDLYLQMLEQMLSQRSRESVPELRRRAPRPYPDVSDSD